MSYTIAGLVDPGLDYDIADLIADGLPDRRILLAALCLAHYVAARERTGLGNGWNYDVATEWNAMPSGWELDFGIMGSEFPGERGIHFTAPALHTVIRLARYFNAQGSGVPDRTHGPWITDDGTNENGEETGS